MLEVYVCPCVRMWGCVRVCVLQKSCEHGIFKTTKENFTKCSACVLCALWDKDDLIRFWVQKVRGQGHNRTKYSQRLRRHKNMLALIWIISTYLLLWVGCLYHVCAVFTGWFDYDYFFLKKSLTAVSLNNYVCSTVIYHCRTVTC